MERTQPKTSLEAYDKITPESLRDIYSKIQNALKVLGRANYDQISTFLGLVDKNMVSRRTKEMEGLEMIYKPGTKSKTSRNRNAYDYALRTQETVVPTLERHNSKEISASDYASVIIAKTKGQKLIQKSLFNEP